MTRASSCILIAAAGLLLSMCGGVGPRYPSAPPPAATESPRTEPSGAAREESAAGMAAAPTPESAPAPAEQPAPASRAPEVERPEVERGSSEGAASRTERRAARADFERARGDLQSALNDCALACKALASMERAVVRLCSLVELPDDRRRCDDAKKRLLDARDRVRVACGTCPGGPSVRRNDPIPVE